MLGFLVCAFSALGHDVTAELGKVRWASFLADVLLPGLEGLVVVAFRGNTLAGRQRVLFPHFVQG